jgi:hypothetical protein
VALGEPLAGGTAAPHTTRPPARSSPAFRPTPQAFCAENSGRWRVLAGEAATMSSAKAAQLLTHLRAELPPAIDDVAPCGDCVLVSVAPGLLPLLGEPGQPACIARGRGSRYALRDSSCVRALHCSHRH